MREILEKRNSFNLRMVEEIKKGSNSILSFLDTVFEKENNFRVYVGEKLSESSYQKAYDEWKEDCTKIFEELKEKKTNFDKLNTDGMVELVDTYFEGIKESKVDQYAKVAVASEARIVKNNLEKEFKPFNDEFLAAYDEKVEKIRKIIELNKKFCVEYGDFSITGEPVTENGYKDIYNKKDSEFGDFTILDNIIIIAEKVKLLGKQLTESNEKLEEELSK